MRTAQPEQTASYSLVTYIMWTLAERSGAIFHISLIRCASFCGATIIPTVRKKSYLYWIRRYILFHGKRHPREMGASEITAFLSHLAVADHVAASTQNQARSAILFLYRRVLHIPIAEPQQIMTARTPKRLPEVFTKDEARRVIAHLTGTYKLMAQLLYGSGLRLRECVRSR